MYQVCKIPGHRGEDVDAVFEVHEHGSAVVGTKQNVISMDLSVKALRARPPVQMGVEVLGHRDEPVTVRVGPRRVLRGPRLTVH